MLKKSVLVLIAGSFAAATTLVSAANAAAITNGAPCATAGASSTVKVKGVAKTYICKVNPSVTGATATTWTLKTCITYWGAAQGTQKSIDEQRALVNNMSEPDKTNYNKQLDVSQAQLNKVLAAIKANHCKVGL
jgi:hypothetical protein